MKEHEESIIKTFIVAEKQDRYIGLLSNKKRRAKVLDALNHCHDLDPRFCSHLASSADVVAVLKAKGAPEQCCIISDIPKIDGQTMLLKEAISIIETEGWGSMVGCIPGKLAYYYGEQGEQRIILEKRK